MKNLHLKHALTPLLLALAVSQAYAVDITRAGANGAPGARGATDDSPGGAGGAGGTVRHRIVTSDAISRLTLNGGHGGAGGSAGTGMGPPVEGTPGGAAGAGGEASGRLIAGRVNGDIAAEVDVRGGNGGNGGFGCCGYWAMQPSAVGAIGSGAATAATSNGNARVQVRASGGRGGVLADGGAAFASGTAAAINGVATGDVLAVGGDVGGGFEQPGPWNMKPMAQGNATADLTVLGSGPASGRSAAVGNVASASLSVSSGGMASGWSQAAGREATATLALRGAGGAGTSTSTGFNAVSSARANTTGRAAVDLTALAQVDTYGGGAAADVHVDSGYGTAAAGNAAITAKALAGNVEHAFGLNSARVTLLGSGNITGTSEARGADSIFTYEGSYTGYVRAGGAAQSFASGITRGGGDVTITALALGGKAYSGSEGDGWRSAGAASAVARGQSDRGRVTVKAESRSSSDGSGSELLPLTHASATTTAAGGSTYAEAKYLSGGGSYSVLAEASSAGSGGARAVAMTVLDTGDRSDAGGMVESRASASGGGMTVSVINHMDVWYGASAAASGANVGGALYALPALQDTAGLVSYATGLPSSTDVAALIEDRAAFAGTDATWLGAGAMGFSNGAVIPVADSTALYSFSAIAGQHLVLGLFGAPANVGDAWLTLSVSSNGVLVFTQDFGGYDYGAHIADQLIALGAVDTGMQNLSITASWHGAFWGPSAYGFNYLVGVSPVPEPSTWLAMLLGLGTLVMVARRRQA